MKVNGQMIRRKDLELRSLLMDVNIKEFIKMENLMVRGAILGQMVSIMKENGSMVSSMVLECGGAIEEIPIKVNGSLANLRAMGYIHGSMVINMKDKYKKMKISKGNILL